MAQFGQFAHLGRYKYRFPPMYQLIHMRRVGKRVHPEIFKHPIDRYPRLDTVLMVEKAVYKYRSDKTVMHIWKLLPQKVMWRTYLTILDYLEYSGKIIVSKDRTIEWIWGPREIEDLKKRGLVMA